jgi:membrane-associated phospholipid phosphatase
MSFIKKALAYGFLFISLAIDSSAQNFDIDLLRSINLNRNSQLDGGMKLLTNAEAYIGLGIPISVLIAGYAKEDKVLLQKGVNMSIALATSTLTTFILKRIVNRQRPVYNYPDIQALVYERYYSFPSGHASNAFCTATSLSLNFKKWYVALPAFAWAGVVGYSRMHLGVHYPSDVLAGAIVGAGSAYATYKVNKMLKSYFKKKYQSAFL